MSALSPSVVALTKDMNGLHVVEHCLKHFSNKDNKQFKALLDWTCRVIQKLIFPQLSCLRWLLMTCKRSIKTFSWYELFLLEEDMMRKLLFLLDKFFWFHRGFL